MKAKSLYIQKLAYDENTGNEIIGLFPSEANPAIVSSYTYDAKRMGGAPTLTATIYSSEPLQWKKEEFVEYNGDRFFASYTPNSTKDNSSRMWKSEITFTSRRELLDNTLFFDVVVDDVDTQNKDRYRSNQTKFTFGGTIYEFVARINSSMAYCGLYRPTDEHKGYYVVIDEGYGTDEVKEVSFEDQYLTDVLQLINTTFELDYYWDGNVCHVGKVQHDLTDTPIKYGSSDALISVSKENANYKIVDMITGYGSSDNLPYYYPNDDEFGEAVFNTENISKDKVSVELSKFLKDSRYNDNLILYKSKEGKSYNGSVDVSSHTFDRFTTPSNLTQADNQSNPTVTCRFSFSIPISAIKGQSVDLTNLNFISELNSSVSRKDYITNVGNAVKSIYIFKGKELYKTISNKTSFGSVATYTFEEDGDFTLSIESEFSYKCKVYKNSAGINDFYGADSWNAAFSGSIEFLYESKSEYEWKNGDKYIPYSDAGINVSEIGEANCIEYDYQFVKDGDRYGFNKVYTGTEDNAVKVIVTDRVWIAPSSVLMPSIYRNTKGAERFYYALNNTHKLPSGSGYYEFVNLYKKGNPHQGTVTFDGIKPTIKGIVNAEGQLFGEIADVAFDKEDSDRKDSDGNYIHSYFYIKLHKFNGDFGFDLFAHALASESAKINLIKSNGCPACSFVICYWDSANNKCYNNVLTDGNGNLKSDSGKMNSKGDYILNDTYVEDNKSNQDSTKEELWICVQKDTSTLGIVMPNANAGFKPQKGDLFVITGIKPPKVLVTAAEKRLDDALVKHMSENNTDQFNYSVKFSRIFLQENPDFASKLNENAKLSIQIQGDSDSDGNLISHEVFVSNYSVKVDNDELAEVEIELVNSLEVTKSDTKQIIDAVKGEAVKSLSSMVGGSNTNSFNASITDKMYLSKLNDDTAKGTITWEKIQKLLSGLLVGNSNSENGGSWTPDTEGRSHLITDYLEVRMKAIFEELVVKKTSTIGGKEIISPAGGVVAHKVEEVTVTYNNVSQKAYRCYFLAEQEGDSVDNDFAVNDQVRSESFNVRKGTYHKVGNHFYWRLVISRDEDPVELEGKKYHYIDLSDTDCATASDVPAKGDVLSQCGNRTDVERQNCLIFSAVDTYSPSVSLYHGINSYSFANREYVEYGVNKQTNKAFFNVYGDMYVGDRPTKENNYEGSSYIKYDSATKQVSIKGKLSAKSTVDGKELSQYIKENSAKGLTEEQVNNLIKNSQVIVDLQNQVDGAIETWFYEGVPTLKNAPASSWTTDKDKDTHLGDLYYDNKTGKAYRFAKDGNTYKWTIITDTDIAKALSDASKAQETADGKMKVFSTQPTPPYQVGDIWVNATYPSDGSTYKNEVLRCQTKKAAGSLFAIGDWIKASKYTDDTVANAAKTAAEKAQKAAEKAQGDISKLGTTVTDNKKAFDNYVKDGYLEPSEIAAMAQDSKRLEDAFAAAEKSYNEVKGAEVLKDTKELTDLNTAFVTLSTAKTELVTYLSDISARYNKADTEGKATIVSAVGTKFTNFQSAYSAFYDKLGLANAYITSKIYVNLGVVIGDVTSLAYLKKALMDTPDTEINGGLVLTSLIGLRDTDGNTTAGINGITEKSAKGGGVAAWFGGEMVDKDYNDGSKTPANTIFRFDGSGYVAGGAIWWGTDGRVHADPTSFIISEKNLGAYLTFFEPTWKAGSAGTSVADLVSLKPNAPFTKLGVSGDATFEGAISFHGIKLTYDATNKAIKVDGNLYATGGITAYGASSVAGGGGLNASVISYARILEGSYTDADLTSIPNAYAIKALSSRIDNIATELGGLNLSWNNITGKPSTFAPSAHKHKWVDITDRITKVSQLTNDAGYLTAHQSLASYYTKAEIDAKGYTTNKGTVTSVALTLPTGLVCATKTITTSGTFAISLASGYSIPTTTKQTAWDGAVSAKHTHSNKSVLDGISSTKVSHWDSAYDWYALMTTDEETADGIINKWNEVVNFLANIAQTDTLSGIVDGINKSISDEVTRAKKAEGVNASGISTNKTNITTLQGYFTSGSAKKALQLTNARKLWGNSFNGTSDINGSIIVPSGKYISIGNIKMEYDATNKALKITNTTTNEVANLYTSGGISAYGVGTSSSSGGGLNGSVKSYSDALKLTSESLSEIASAYSIKALASRISSLEGGSATSISVSGSGNAVTSVTKNGTTISVVKGATFLTSHQSLSAYLKSADAEKTYSKLGHTHAFSEITGKPTTLAGYGVTDGVNAVSVTGNGNAVTSASIDGHTLTLTKGSTFSLSNHTHYVGTTQVQGSSAEQALTGITKIDNILKLSKATVTVNTSYKAEQNRLVIYGNTYGNDANYIKSARKLSYGDGGPQLVFSTSENPDASGVQSAALVYTDHDTIGAGVSLSFVTNQGDAYFIAPHIKALTAFQGNLAWSYITNKPTTLSGFGITDGLRSVTHPSGSNVFVTGISTSGTAITYTKSYTKKSLSAVGSSGWTNASIDGNIIPDMSFIAYWNGACSGTSSNLAYCNKGAFGSFAIKNSLAFSELTSKPTTISGYGITDAYTKAQVDSTIAKYLPLAGGTITGALTVNGIATFKSKVAIGDIYIINDGSGNLYVQKTDGKTAANFYATGGITAFGASSVSGGTGSGLNGSVLGFEKATAMTSADNGDSSKTEVSFLATAWSIKQLNDKINAFGTGVFSDYLTIAAAKATYQPKGSYLTAHQSLDGYVNEVATSGTGNAITLVSKSGKKLTFTKGATFLTSHQSLAGYATQSWVNGKGYITSSGSITGNAATATHASSADYIRNNVLPTPANNTIKAYKDSIVKYFDIYSNGGIGANVNVGASIITNWEKESASYYGANTYSVIKISGGYAGTKYAQFLLSSYGTTDIGVVGRDNDAWKPIRWIAYKGDLPTNNNQLTNGAGYITSAGSCKYATSAGSANSVAWSNVSGRPTKVSQLSNDIGYITSSSSISGNAGSATKLQTTHTIWGQPFNGTADISISTAAKMTYLLFKRYDNDENAGYIGCGSTSDNNIYIENYVGESIVFASSNSSNVGIGTYTPSEKLHVSGNIYSTGDIKIGGAIRDASNVWLLGATQSGLISLGSSAIAADRVIENANGKLILSSVGNVITSYSSKFGIAYPNTTDIYNYFEGGDKLQLHIGSWTSNKSSEYVFRIMAWNGGSGEVPALTVAFNGNVGIQNSYPSEALSVAGNILATGGVTAYSSSDIRLKQDLRKLDYLSIVKAMGGTFGFAWKKDNTRSIGWIAQHVLCNPHLKDIVETDENGYYKINYWSPKLIATAFGAIEQVGDEVSRLKARVVFLESEVQRLSGKQDGNNKKRLDNKNINLLN